MNWTLYEAIRAIANDQVRQVRTVELAVVQAVHAGGNECHACTVQLRNSAIVLNKVPVATPKIGTTALPGVGDLVMVQFIDGDINAPVITGCLYNDEDQPPAGNENRIVSHLPGGAKDDEAVHFELCNDQDKQIIIRVGKAAVIELSEKDPAVRIDVNNGKGTITIESDGTMAIKNQGDLKIESLGKVEIKGDGGVKIESSAQVEVKGALIKLN